MTVQQSVCSQVALALQLERYDKAVLQLTEAGLVEPGELPSLEVMMRLITDAADELDLVSNDFEAFFSSWDVLTAYDQLDTETNVQAHKPALAIAFEALQLQGSIGSGEELSR